MSWNACMPNIYPNSHLKSPEHKHQKQEKWTTQRTWSNRALHADRTWSKSHAPADLLQLGEMGGNGFIDAFHWVYPPPILTTKPQQLVSLSSLDKRRMKNFGISVPILHIQLTLDLWWRAISSLADKISSSEVTVLWSGKIGLWRRCAMQLCQLSL